MMKIERVTKTESNDPWYVRSEADVAALAHYDFEMAWASIYHTFDDAFDYRGKPFYNDNDNSVIVDGITYYASPF